MCSKPDRNGYPTFDLSHDSEAEPTVPFALNVTDLRFPRVLTRAVAGASHFQPIINSRLLAMIRSKLWRMGKALSRKNAFQRKLIFSRWEKSNWIVELESAEENARLACHLEKKTLEVEKLKEENSDIRVTLEEAKDENSTLHSELSSAKAKNEDLQHRLDAETGTRSPLQPLNGVVVGSRKRKPWDEYSHRHKKRKIQELKEKVVDLEDDQFEVTAIHVRNKDTGSSGVIPAQAGVQVAAEVRPLSDDQVKKVLLVKDRYGISNEAYTMSSQCLMRTFLGRVKLIRKQN